MGNVYANLALNSLRKNKNFYLPYIMSSAVMIALYFTLQQIATDPVIRGIHGGKTLTMILNIGLPVIALLSALFIVYMSSFIMKRRKKEIGLYSVLGMEKRHVIRVVFLENIIVSASAIAGGMIGGVIFEKLAQLLLLKLLRQDADLNFNIDFKSVQVTLIIFAGIFIFILLNSIREILFKNTLTYIKEEQAGEKKPKARWALGLIGLVILGIAYYLACTVTSGGVAINRFANAVMLVIVATYILFIVGSIAVLELMKRNKNYYYKTNHFISVSGMVYRMKRNGAGLASICILSTMVLVMLSSVTTVLFYNDKAFDDRFLYDFDICADDYKHVDENNDAYTEGYDSQEIIDQIYDAADNAGVTVTDLVSYKTYCYYGDYRTDFIGAIPNLSGEYVEYWLVTNEDYNRINHTDLNLEENQLGYYFLSGKFSFDTSVDVEGVGRYAMLALKDRPLIMPGEYTSTCLDVCFIVVPDELGLRSYLDSLDSFWQLEDPDFVLVDSILSQTYFAFNVEGSDEDEIQFFNTYNEMYLDPIPDDNLSEYNTNFGRYEGVYRTIFCSALFRQVFYNMYGGLFFLGILLSIACIVIAVLIMYFKQLIEGFEDAKRFAIMKKVGLTNEEIKKSVYSQIVMVFLTPLVAAGIHTAFAYNMIKSLITLFGISNIDGYFVILLISMAVFMVFYGIVFLITGQKYFDIVNKAENAI